MSQASRAAGVPLYTNHEMELRGMTRPEPAAEAQTLIVLGRDENGNPISNVPWSVVHHSPDGYEWGYGGSGPSDLALNILNWFVPPGMDQMPTVPCWKRECSWTAWEHHITFKTIVIAAMPRDGGSIEGAVIFHFLAKADGRRGAQE